MNKEMRNKANFRATITIITVSIAIAVMIKKFTK